MKKKFGVVSFQYKLISKKEMNVDKNGTDRLGGEGVSNKFYKCIICFPPCPLIKTSETIHNVKFVKHQNGCELAALMQLPSPTKCYFRPNEL